MPTRYFEFIGGNSAKFWEVADRDHEVTVRFGRIGTQGQTRVKSFPDSTAAARHAERLVTAKTGKGYVEAAPDNLGPILTTDRSGEVRWCVALDMTPALFMSASTGIPQIPHRITQDPESWD